MRALKHFYRNLGEEMWGPYGFYDAFNLGRDWYADSYLAIDQGPIINMIENHRSGLLWDLFMSNPEIGPALEAIGFVEDTTTALQPLPAVFNAAPEVFPNPASTELSLRLPLARATTVRVALLDVAGSQVQSWGEVQAGPGTVLPLHLRPRPKAGYYLLRITTPEGAATVPLLLQP